MKNARVPWAVGAAEVVVTVPVAVPTEGERPGPRPSNGHGLADEELIAERDLACDVRRKQDCVRLCIRTGGPHGLAEVAGSGCARAVSSVALLVHLEDGGIS